MAKTSRRTKAKKKDFNKVKLKVGKRKPQADNATETSFKSQSIFIPTQLKNQNAYEVTTSRKQTIPELLSHLNHFNTTFRQQSLIGLKEILLANQNLVIDGTGILEKVVKTITDEEADVRKSCINVLAVLFSMLSERKMAPHFSLVLSHLYCAMSHISTGVQKDSFKVFDLCLKFYPQLICRHDDQKLLRYFIELISSKQGDVGGRVLTLKMSKKESAITWRIRVLTRLETLLKITFSDGILSSNKNVNVEKRVQWNDDNVGVNLLKPRGCGSGILLKDLNKTTIITETTKMSDVNLIKVIIPLLIQCWLEVGGNGILPKDNEAIVTMRVVLSITYQLCKNCCNSTDDKKIMVDYIRRHYFPMFQKHFISNFPYLESEHIKTSKTKGPNNQKFDIMEINLNICNLISLLTTPETISNDDNISEVLTFISTILNEGVEYRSPIITEHLESLLNCVETLFHFMNVEEEQNLLVEPLYLYCNSLSTKHPNKGIITKFLIKMFQQHATLLKNESISCLLSSLPKQLTSIFNELGKKSLNYCQIKSDDSIITNFSITLECMKSSAQRKHKIFLFSLNENYLNLLCSIYNNCEHLFCEELCQKCENLQAKLFEITIPYLATLENSVSVKLQQICSHARVSLDIVSYISDLLFQRFDPVYFMLGNKTEERNEEKILFMKFLLSLLTNFENQDDLVLPDNFQLSGFPTLIHRQSLICDLVCETVGKMCALNNNVYKFIFAFFEKKILMPNQQVKISAMIGFLKLEEKLFYDGMKLPKDVGYLWSSLRNHFTRITGKELIHKIFVALKSNIQ